ncbi:acyl-CoA dehydrogenase family protein [Pseudonocardia endophytica]|uniref:Alkylation response protein AidB-like acyl-CoA dehydrogenase n=1 Tax=Pseudonocardia endophytica TaxID=401976 RepID=A0A4R1I3A2_PSEEN|nr:acyl-CoA dehydrogenase family protein [Pseudonocardia endophytica]TCK24452.1 alkylation response protein AidB-like acyl-CoA dehydrogenase [Pseudonocardia endophytica]
MQLVPTAEQEDLRTAVRDLLADHASSSSVREAFGSETGYDADLWRRLGRDLGVLGLAVPESAGGAGAGHVDRAVVAEELGRALVPSPFLGSSVLAVDLLSASGETSLLPDLASGERIGAVAVAGAPGPGGILHPGGAVKADGDRLTGRAAPVLDGAAADVLLVLAETGDGPRFFRVDAGADGVRRTPLRSLDPTRRLARIDLDGAQAVPLEGDATAALARVADLAAVAVAAEQVGVMRHAVEQTVGYVTEREQFGRQIGSYQAVKHGLADMYAATELATPVARAAAWAADHDPDGLPLAAAVARVQVGPAAFAVADGMVRYHGGVGYTWEHDAHLHYKRAKTDELLFGSPARSRARLADLIGV